MANAWWLVGAVFVIGLALLAYAGYVSYQRKARRARAKSRAALNLLLAEADEIAQRSAPPTTDDGQ